MADLLVDESYQAAHRWISSGEAGRTHLIHSATNDLYDSTGFFVQYSQASGGIFVDCGESDDVIICPEHH
jgi:myo-inositol 2-dehydrogenase/D-chiro-inositol 1-dehydrogenase